MADDLDVEAMLEAPYKKEDEGGKEGSRDREKDSKRHRSRDRERKRDRDRDRDGKHRDGDRDRDRSRRDRDRKRSKSRDRKRSRSKDRKKSSREKRSRSKERKHRSRSRERRNEPDLTPEERDSRTVFCMQLSARIRPRDLEEFFSSVGKVKDVRLIMDNKTRRSKGIAYVEFGDVESVPLAMGLNGQRLLGAPILVQVSQAEKNRQANAAAQMKAGNTGPMRLYVGSLHFNITEDMLRGIFEPFGKIDECKLIMNHETGRSQGYGFISFHNSEDAKKALEQLNGFELAGRPMKVGHVTERSADNQGSSVLDTDELDRAGIDLGATGRLQLMAKLAEGTGFQIPQVAANALNMPNPPAGAAMPGQPPVPGAAPSMQQPASQQVAPPIATQCFMLSNMFDPNTENNSNWDNEIRDDVIDECNKHGGVLHIFVDKASPQGNVYVKCPSIAAAVATVQALHGRWFAGKMIAAAYVPLPNYHSLFPDSSRVTQLLLPSSASQHSHLGLGAPGGFQQMQFMAQ